MPPLANCPPAVAAVIESALQAVEPAAAVRAHLRRAGDLLTAGDAAYDLREIDRVIVVGAGKAGAPMAQAVEGVLGARVSAGCVVVKHGHGMPHGATTQRIAIREAAHPVPDQAGLDAGAEVLRLLEGSGPRDLVIALLSGGGSALLEALPPGLTLDDWKAANRALLASGATIVEMNAVRKHLSLLKGGQLARAAAPARLLTLVLSDVVGSPLDVIASGPTVPDRTTWQDAWGVVERFGLTEMLPPAVSARLRAGPAGSLPDTPKPGDSAFAQAQTVIVGDNAAAAEAARRAAQEQGYGALILSTFVEGEAREVAKVAAALGREVQAHGRPLPAPACLILGGETTVTLGGEHGFGGRNQEAALTAALALAGTRGITVVALATDGSDGPTDAAGGIVDGATVAAGVARGLDAHDALRRHDAYPYLDAVGALLRTGPTRTNVNDLLLVFAEEVSGVGD